MKNINVLSLLLLLASAQIYGDANPELSLICAYQAVEALNRSVASDNDDAGALKLLETMDECISFDINNKKSLAATNGMLFKTPLDQAKIDADIKSLQSRINTLDHNISEFKKGGIMPSERTKIDNRRAERRAKIQAANEKQQALKDSQVAMDAAQKAQTSLQESLAKNELLFEQALESYILSFGQCYLKAGSVVISSKYDQNMPITAKEYNQLIATLNKAYSTFGAAATIALDLDSNNAVSTQQVANYIKQIPLASAQSWAMFGAKAALGVGAAILATAVVTAAVVVGANAYQGKNWNDTEDAMGVYNAGVAKGSQAYNDAANSAAAQSLSQAWNNVSSNASQAYDNAANSAAAQKIAGLWNSASSTTKNAWNSAANSSAVQSVQDWFGVMKPQQQQQAANITNDAMNSDDALVVAAAAQQLADAVNNNASDEEIAHYADLFDSMEESLGNGKNLSANLSDEERAELLPYAAMIMVAPITIGMTPLAAAGVTTIANYGSKMIAPIQTGLATYRTLSPLVNNGTMSAAAARNIALNESGITGTLAAGKAGLQNAGAAISAQSAAALAAARAQMEAVKQAALGVQQKYAAGQAANLTAVESRILANNAQAQVLSTKVPSMHTVASAQTAAARADAAKAAAAQVGYNPYVVSAQNAAAVGKEIAVNTGRTLANNAQAAGASVAAGAKAAANNAGTFVANNGTAIAVGGGSLAAPLAVAGGIQAYNDSDANDYSYDSQYADDSMNATDADYDFFN